MTTSASKVNHSTSTAERVVTTYPPRRRFKPYVVRSPEVPGVEDAIDIHCHAAGNQQDAASILQLGSKNKFGGLLYKSFGKRGGPSTMTQLNAMVESLKPWAEAEGIELAKCWAGYGVARGRGPVDPAKLRTQLDEGITGVWLPVANSAHTLNLIGGLEMWWDDNANPKAHTDPLPWEEAKARGRYMLDDNGKLKSEYAESIRIVAEYGRALFFGHPTHPELWAVVDLLDTLGYNKAVVDHPYSPFVDLTIEEMKQIASRGILLNFTYDELSPMLGVDPGEMYKAIREVGVEHFTLSSDAGDQLFPNSIESMRLIIGFMTAYGCTPEEIRTMSVTNPQRVVGLRPY